MPIVTSADDIRAELYRRNMSIRDLAEASGVDENKITKSLLAERPGGPKRRRITVEELEAFRIVLVPDDDEPEPIRTIPLLGEVPAGRFAPAEQRGGKSFPVSDPDTPRRAYALAVKGDSMNLVVPDGATLVIDPDDTKLWPGECYIIRTQDGETTFKEYRDGPARLVPCSDNPEHREIAIGDEPIDVLGKVFSFTVRMRARRAA